FGSCNGGALGPPWSARAFKSLEVRNRVIVCWLVLPVAYPGSQDRAKRFRNAGESMGAGGVLLHYRNLRVGTLSCGVECGDKARTDARGWLDDGRLAAIHSCRK